MSSLRTLRTGLRSVHGGALSIRSGISAGTRPRARLAAAPALLTPTLSQRRTFIAEAASSVSAIFDPPINAIANLILTSPWSYPATILALTIGLRTAVSLPTVLWVRSRQRRLAQVVTPLLKAENERLAFQVMRECRARGAEYEEYQKELKKQVKDSHFKLHRKHGTHPTFTLIAPIVVNIPILILVSLGIRHAIAEPGSPLVGQALLWVSNMTEPDPTGAFGLLAGALAFTSTEIYTWRKRVMESAAARGPEASAAPLQRFSQDNHGAATAPASAPVRDTAANRSASAGPAPRGPGAGPSAGRTFTSSAVVLAAPPRRRAPVDPRRTKQVVRMGNDGRPVAASPGAGAGAGARGPGRVLQDLDVVPGGAQAVRDVNLTMKDVFGHALKLWCLGIIVLSLQVPAALVFYWTCSIAYTVVQTLSFSLYDERQARALRRAQVGAVWAGAEAGESAARQAVRQRRQ